MVTNRLTTWIALFTNSWIALTLTNSRSRRQPEDRATLTTRGSHQLVDELRSPSWIARRSPTCVNPPVAEFTFVDLLAELHSCCAHQRGVPHVRVRMANSWTRRWSPTRSYAHRVDRADARRRLLSRHLRESTSCRSAFVLRSPMRCAPRSSR